jgi:hypothetical protein
MAWKKVFERSPVPLAKVASRSVKATVPLPHFLLLLYVWRALSISLTLAETSLRVFGLWWFASFSSHSASSSRSEFVRVWRWWSRAGAPRFSIVMAFLTLPTVARGKCPVFRAFFGPAAFFFAPNGSRGDVAENCGSLLGSSVADGLGVAARGGLPLAARGRARRRHSRVKGSRRSGAR